MFSASNKREWHELELQSTPDNSNLQGKSRLREIENSSSYRELEEDGQEYGKNSYCTVNILITLNCLCLIVEMLNENWKILLDYKPGVVNR